MALKNYFKIILLVCFLMWAPTAWGVTLSWQESPDNLTKEIVILEVVLDTVDKKINTVAGEINILADWQLTGVSDANSLVNFWIERSDLSAVTPAGRLSFAGIVPGGYQGRGLLLTLELTPKNYSPDSTNSIISVKNFTALLNDGSGQAVSVAVAGLTPGRPIENWRVAPETKMLPAQPEIFSPLIVKDANFPTNDSYLVFATQDKSSGLAYYAVYESWWPVWRVSDTNKKLAWIKTDSPYQLKNQTWWNFIYVKAVNQAGEARLVKVFPQFSRSWLYRHGLLLVIILGVMTVLSLLVIKWNRS